MLTIMGLLAIVVVSIMSYSIKVPSFGKLKKVGIEVYSDPSCTVVLDQIDWGYVEPGETELFVAYLKAVGNKAVNVTLNTDGWNPSIAQTYITLSWDYPQGKVLEPNESTAVTFSLKVDGAISGVDGFSFNIILTSTG